MKNSKVIVLFLLELILMVLGAMSSFSSIICFALSLIVSVFIALEAKPTRGASVCCGIMLLLMLQNFCIGIGAHLAGNSDSGLRLITQIPSVSLLIISFIVTGIKSKLFFINKSALFFVLLCVFSLLSLFIGHGQLLGIIVNIRNLIAFYFAYCLAKSLLINDEQRCVFYAKMMRYAKIMLVAGIILLIGGYSLYSMIGIKEVYIAKGITTIANGLDDRFYTSLISKKLMRMGSLYYEPVNLAYFYASLLVLVLCPICEQKNRSTDLAICIAGLLLTIGKGGILLALACVLFYGIMTLREKIKTNKKIRKAALLSGLFVIVCGVLFSVGYYIKIGAASSPHFWAVMRTWNNVIAAPLGHGLGTGGNMSNLFNSGSSNVGYNSSWLSTGGESALMAFLYQAGIPAMIMLFLTLYHLMPKAALYSKNKRLSVYWFLSICLFAISILQDNTFTPQCIVLPMFMVGAASTTLKVKDKNEK